MESVGIKSYDTALKNSLRKDKPLLIIISASWCGACHAMESGLMEPASRRAIEQTAHYKLDFDSPRTQKLRERFYGGKGVPEMILISNEGKELLRERGWAGSENFSLRLREAISKN
jgi:thiol-disulfide isomerase/thioredoxin